MALFNKLFSTHKRKNVSTAAPQQNTSQFPFSNEQVRILLYRECDWRGRRLLFDSMAIQKVNLSSVNGASANHHSTTNSSINNSTITNNSTTATDNKKYPNFIDTINGYGYKYTRPDESDLNGIGEMVFGSVSMSVRATTLKVHWLQGPSRILCSQVFLSPVQSNNTLSSNTLDTAANDLNSFDTSSLNSFSLSVSVCVSDNLNALGTEKPHTNPLDVPPPASESSDGDRSFAYSDSGYSGTDPWNASGSSYYPYNSSTRSSFGSVYSDRDTSRKFSTDSSITDIAITARNDGNLQRRIIRNVTTSFENRKSISDSIGYIGDSHPMHIHGGSGGGVIVGVGGSDGCVTLRGGRRCSEQVESRSNPEMIRKRGASGDAVRSHHSSYGPGARTAGKRAKLGLAICITLSESVEDDMQLFCSEHIILLESMLCRLRATAENAYVNQKKFYQIMLHAWFSTTEWISDLFTAPRLTEPIWLALSSGYSQNPMHLAQRFMNELCWLLNSADTKDTNFFISTLLTAILTHHLGWVGTVAPLSGAGIAGINAMSPNEVTAAANIAKQEKAKMSEISKFHPYNVLWAQMGDLYGAIGNPPKLSKTIVCGTETTTMDKVLNVLTYFIRCGQIERDLKTEVFEKTIIDDILDEFVNSANGDAGKIGQNEVATIIQTNSASDSESSQFPPVAAVKRSSGLTRTSTCLKDLTSLSADGSTTNRSDDIKEAVNSSFVGAYQKRNDIPNVLIFRDSRVVRQELRIGNFLMDTGIEMNTKQKRDIRHYQVKGVDHIKLLVTSPDNEEYMVNDGESNSTDDTVEEATESIGSYRVDVERSNLKTSPSLSDLITANSIGSASLLTGASAIGVGLPNISNNSNGVVSLTSAHQPPSTFLWGIEPIKEGLSVEQWQHIEKGLELKNGNCLSDGNVENSSTYTGNTITEFKRSKSLYTKSTNVKNSEHIRKSKFRKKSFTDFESPTQQSNIENVDPAPNALKTYPSLSDLITENSVGVSERLTWGIEPVKETVTLDEEQHFEFAKKMIAENIRRDPGVVFTLGGDNETLVNLKNSTAVAAAAKLEEARSAAAAAAQSSSSSSIQQTSTTTINNNNSTATITKSTRKTCSHKKHSGVKFNFEKYPQIATNYMKNKNIDLTHYDFIEKSMKLEQSPSTYNDSDFQIISATTTDDESSSECECCAGNLSHFFLQTPSNATELEFSSDDNSYPPATPSTIVGSPQQRKQSCAMVGGGDKSTKNPVDSDEPMFKGVAARSAAAAMANSGRDSNTIQLITLPISKYVYTDESRKKKRHRPGFIPSLFVGITDHYVADMVLQGTNAPMSKWETNLKHNLALSSHCATLEQTPTENIAIIAQTDKWDVKVVSSQTYVLPCGSGTSGPIGMSQLVSSMLETVHAMWSAGIPAFQCMSFMESKLQEMYLQSETLAAFLLATEFCSLSTVTSALNLSANDVPLLLSVASIHSPQVTKKYGVSFR